jgi:hypothetical protein
MLTDTFLYCAKDITTWYVLDIRECCGLNIICNMKHHDLLHHAPDTCYRAINNNDFHYLQKKHLSLVFVADLCDVLCGIGFWILHIIKSQMMSEDNI